jgi:hypothetical protein
VLNGPRSTYVRYILLAKWYICVSFLILKALKAVIRFALEFKTAIYFRSSRYYHRGIMWPSLVKIQYTELKLSCGNDPVVKNYIYSNGDLDLWPNDPKIHRVLPLLLGIHVAKFGQDPIYRTKVIVRKRSCCQKFYL